MKQFKPETHSGENIVYLNHTHSGMVWRVMESSVAPLSQPGNSYMVIDQYPVERTLLPATPRDQLLAAEDHEFNASLERSLREYADVWAELAER